MRRPSNGVREILLVLAAVAALPSAKADESGLRVGAAAAELVGDDSMVIAGGINAHYATGQEGKLRSVAVVIEKPGDTTVAIVACDVLWVPRDICDPAVAEIKRTTGIPAENILINATHTHHAPSTKRAHDFGESGVFRERVREAIIKSVQDAHAKLAEGKFFFKLGEENTVGRNSRLLLPDAHITWLSHREAVGKEIYTGPFDPEMPVFDFRDPAGNTKALIYNHSTHTIGTRTGTDVRSPSFYGLAAQELEDELGQGAIVSFLEGASGSTHNITGVPVAEAVVRFKDAIKKARGEATEHKVHRLKSIKRPFKFTVRVFNELEEDNKVASYTERHSADKEGVIRKVFANMRKELAPQQGQERETWIQAMLIGDVAIVGVPAEYFTGLGVRIKENSPFEHTYVAELANDWVGYMPDLEGHRLGGYQTWMGLHSYSELGTGERVADEVVAMLHELAGTKPEEKKDEPAGEKTSQAPASPLEPEQERASFALTDPALEVELVAREPDVVSPVSVAWDADGRMFVAEMIGYPQTEGLGRVSRLEDRDGDGHYEQATVFADKLGFPTSVMPYRDGVLVACAPDILFMKDADGDGRADVQEVLFTGFGTGSQQLRANSLHWGLDNWIYGANGRCDGEIRRPGGPDAVISIRARDFRFNPATRVFEAITGQSQFGQVHDDWGRRFLSWNTIPVRHVVVPDEFLQDHPELAPQAVVDTAAPDDTGQVYPRSPPPQQFNGERANFYNAMCGLSIYRGDLLGPNYAGNAFIGESLTNLVTRRKLQPSGPTFVATRPDGEADWLASTDSWFHPVNTATGPDGALYVVDFYRELVEHPIYVPSEEIRQRVDWRKGHEHGRIWRIRRADTPIPTDRKPQLSNATTEELVAALSHPVGWWRDTAQRLLVEHRNQDAVPLLEPNLQVESPLGRLHSLYALDGLEALSDQLVIAALDDENPRIREHAVRLAARRGLDVLERRATDLASDPDFGVRFQTAFAVRNSELLAGLLVDSKFDRWTGRAVLASGGREIPELLAEIQRLSHSPEKRSIDRIAFFLAAGRALEPGALDDAILALVDERSQDVSDDVVALLGGAGESGSGIGTSIRGQIPHHRIFDKVVAVALESEAPLTLREAAITALAKGLGPRPAQTLRTILDSPDHADVQTVAAAAAASLGNSDLCAAVYESWELRPQAVRRATLAHANRSEVAVTALVMALESGKVSAIELPLGVDEQLLKATSGALRERLAAVLAGSRNADRQEVIARYTAALELQGDVTRGSRHFREHCMNCHTIQRIGRTVGPDLSGIAARPVEALLIDILDPSRTVAQDYLAHTAETTAGLVHAGVIVSETADSVTLRPAEGQDLSIPRDEIEAIRASGKSLMPDGFEQKLDVAALADLIAFLRAPRRDLLEQTAAR